MIGIEFETLFLELVKHNPSWKPSEVEEAINIIIRRREAAAAGVNYE